MRVLWLTDQDPWISLGGAELNDRGHVMEGWRRGHEVEVCTADSFDTVARGDFDLAVVSNVASFPQAQVRAIAEAGDYVVFHHDFLSICRYRLHFPQLDRCRDMRCEAAEVWGPVVENAELNVALSPLHEEVLERHHGDGADWVHVPSSIDPKPFIQVREEGNDRSGTLVVNPAEFKGKEKVLEWVGEHGDERFTFLGDIDENVLPSNCSVRDRVPYGQMPDVYGEFERVLHLPETVDPFCRVVTEAALAGCEVVTNRNVGATSYDWFGDLEDTATAVTNAPDEFWDAVEELD